MAAFVREDEEEEGEEKSSAEEELIRANFTAGNKTDDETAFQISKRTKS